MQAISDWLREIILVILLAAFIDLLLPSSSMQRYVKVVLSLFILMTILFPIISLFKSDLNELEWQTDVIEPGKVQSLNEILEDGQKLKQYNEQHSTQYVENQLADMMKKELDQELSEIVNSVQVTTNLNADTNKLELDEVKVTLGSKAVESTDQVKSEDLIVPIVPVESVFIEIDLDEQAEVKDQSKSDLKLKEQVHEILEKQWGITAKQLEISFIE